MIKLSTTIRNNKIKLDVSIVNSNYKISANVIYYNNEKTDTLLVF